MRDVLTQGLGAITGRATRFMDIRRIGKRLARRLLSPLGLC